MDRHPPPESWVTEALAARRPIMTPDEVCEDLRISRRTLGRMVADGRLRAVHIGGQLRIPRVEVQNYLAGLDQ